MNSNTEKPLKVVLTGPVQLELLAPYFRTAGYDVGASDVAIDAFKPDYVYDVTAHDKVLEKEVPGFRDARMEALSGCPYSIDGIRAIVDEFQWETLRSPRKILALDADNTLWKGILSEDGPNALAPFTAFQAGLKQLAAEGVVLVLLSKNDEGSLEGLERLDFLGGLETFASHKVNWAPKPGNLIEACREINLGVESVVFVDDNPHERALMSAHLPEVAIAPFPNDLNHPEQFLRRLKEYFFSNLGATDEDRLRSRDYRANAQREQFLKAGGYLDALELEVTPSRATEGDLDRLAQMAGKTNQFNATTLRRSRDEFARMLKDASTEIYVFRTRDKFGEQGIVCYVVIDRANNRVTDFVMSCRAMGRTLEHYVYGFICTTLGATPIIDFAPTAKNRPFADFYATLPHIDATHYRRV